jgi:hypothetical protein
VPCDGAGIIAALLVLLPLPEAAAWRARHARDARRQGCGRPAGPRWSPWGPRAQGLAGHPRRQGRYRCSAFRGLGF